MRFYVIEAAGALILFLFSVAFGVVLVPNGNLLNVESRYQGVFLS